MRQPSEADIEAAKEYLRQRLDAERSMVRNLEYVMREAAGRIVAICYSANVNPKPFQYTALPRTAQIEIDSVIVWLRETIDDYFVTLAIADHEENRDEVLPLILAENHGMTFGERLEDYCDKYRNELMLLVGAGLFLGVGETALVKSIGENLRHPYANQLLLDGIAAPLTYGRGRTNSMFTALSGLTTYGIAQGWMRDWELTTEAKGAIGWEVRRGSSYPCAQCDENCGFHAIDEGTLLPQHLSCCCFAVPVYLK